MKGGGKRPGHARAGHRVGTMNEFLERNEGEEEAAARKRAEGQADCSGAGGEDSDDEEEARRPKAAASLLERDADLDAELEAQFGNEGGLTRKQREELERQAEAQREEKARREGNSDEAKADMERLAEIRARREEAAKKKAEELKAAEEKAAKSKEKAAAEDRQRLVAEEIVKLSRAKDGKLTLNQLNQDAGCKKVLKPLCKKEGVKAINKAWLDKYPDLFSVEPDGQEFVIKPKA